jgi:catechol 2,3-dioxygenase-like lactoylglutathione lyase family enzyme
VRLNQVTVGVTDIPRAIDFYRQLGLKPVVLDVHYARFVCPDGGSTFSIHSADAVTPGMTVVYFECDDLDDQVARLKAKGVALSSGPTDESWLWREARLTDPDGNPICLFYAGENRLNPPWRVHEGAD